MNKNSKPPVILNKADAFAFAAIEQAARLSADFRENAKGNL